MPRDLIVVPPSSLVAVDRLSNLHRQFFLGLMNLRSRKCIPPSPMFTKSSCQNERTNSKLRLVLNRPILGLSNVHCIVPAPVVLMRASVELRHAAYFTIRVWGATSSVVGPAATLCMG